MSPALDPSPPSDPLASEWEEPAGPLSGTRALGRARRELTLLYMKHRQTVYRLALRYSVGQTAWAEDVTQEVFLKAMHKLSELRDTDDLGAWFYRVTTNQCLKKLRSERLRSFARLEFLYPSDSSAPSAEARFVAHQDLGVIEHVLRRLPPKERVAFCMVHLDGLSQTEVALTLGLSKGYVSKLLTNAVRVISAEMTGGKS